MSEIPRGAIRFNTDSNKPELWDGSQWAEFQLSTPNLGQNGSAPVTWSNFVSNGSSGSTAPSKAFDGDIANNSGYSETNWTRSASNGSTPATFDVSSLESMKSVTEVKVYAYVADSGNDNTILAVNGSNVTTGGDSGFQVYTVSVSGLQTIAYKYVSGSGPYVYLTGVSVSINGGTHQELIDGQTGFGNPDTTPGARGIIGGGGFNVPTTTYRNSIEYVNIASAGNSFDFGDLNVARYYLSATASRTRAVFSGGQASPGLEKTMEFVTIASTGNATDFGEDHANLKRGAAGCGNQTRGLFGSGYTPSPSFTPNNVIEYITIASTGNANDFGDLVTTSAQRDAFSSPVRGIWCGGYHPGNPHGQIDFVNIASTGNAQSFGDLVQDQIRVGGGSNATRGVYFGGQTSPGGSRTGDINYVTIATSGNAVHFGDLLATEEWPRMMSSSTRGIVAGGSPGPYIGTYVIMQQLNFSTQGNTVGFGDLTEGRTFGPGATSNAHGGL